ncbi:MAG: hypothetical protein QF412_01805, partial [Planctomycetota bacterium]|nr:hypothetical protein [Planctomycetota bacterium]
MTFSAGKAVRYLTLIILANLFSCTRADQEDHVWLEWGELPELPDASGFAGAFAGVSNDVLILAGGANFPDGRPWEGHPKIWHDRIFVLADPDGQWQLADMRLPRPLAYGVSISWNDRLLCFGGGDGEQHHANAFALRWTGKGIEIDELPSMPQAAAFFCGARVENEIFLAGGLRDPDASEATHSFWSLDLQQQSPQWKSLPPWPGPPRHLSVAGVQGKAFFLFSGIELRDGQRVKPYLTDGYRFSKGSWQPIASLPRPVAAAPDPAVALGSSHLLVLGGDGGTHSAALEDAHPGFDPSILAYHAITDTWIESGSLPKVPGPDPAQTPNGGHWPPVTTPVVTWRGRIVVPSGEVRPGVRTPRVPFARTIEPPSPFGSLDYTVLTAYLLCLLLMGCYFARREKGTNDFFLGG